MTASIFYLFVNALASHVQNHLPITQILFLQNLIALCCLIPSIWNNKHFFQITNWKIHLIRDLAGLASYYFIFLALKTINLVDATTLHFTGPFFVPILSYFWLKERFSPHVWWSIGLGFTGIVIIIHPSWDVFHAGALIALLGAAATALALSAVRHLLLKGEPPQRILFLFFAVSALTMLPFCAVNWVAPTIMEWFSLVAIGIFAIANQQLLTKGFSLAPISYFAPFAYSSIVYAALFNWFVFKEPIGIRSFLGSAMIIIGGSFTYLLAKREVRIHKQLEESGI